MAPLQPLRLEGGHHKHKGQGDRDRLRENQPSFTHIPGQGMARISDIEWEKLGAVR
jgi:hypothetical protein